MPSIFWVDVWAWCPHRCRGAELESGWIDPEAGKITVAEFAPRWLKTKAGRKAKTRYG